ncbi:GyrI-like domain-containing protein [Phototrophicus methaneseepsis]|uniref:GyrI-like domain-containing protein n=1 Tax=Phototrophicus methaneseepsis TaxID=2710758 RepID=A0A7S8EAM1_9CHLR|nr:GyrI-like domain-containing protein [Phototrophicus methaneseepsis]QPC83435.1 GyrI-like domain-containing protein [Phototrophicus methaneseepsis]
MTKQETPNLDMKKQLKDLYQPSSKHVSVVNVPPLSYLMIDGEGNPNTTPRYYEAIQALYQLAYHIRAICKAGGNPFTVMPLEGLWWFNGEANTTFDLTTEDKDRFGWTMMIVMPDRATQEIVSQARDNLRKKDPAPLHEDIRFETYHEEEAVQIMHIGPYATEGPTVRRLHDCIDENGWHLSKKHHEIYISDARRVTPEKMKTIIRQPFARH